MYLLFFVQGDIETTVGVFETLDDGREFVEKIPGYTMEKEFDFEYESFDSMMLPDYLELDYHGNKIPITRFMFTEEALVEIFWREIPNLSKEGEGLVDGITRVDAYVVDNKDVQEYIAKRENQYIKVKGLLEAKNLQVDRFYFGSEDGEAVVYKKDGDSEWHFLAHMDPSFVEEKDIEAFVDENLML